MPGRPNLYTIHSSRSARTSNRHTVLERCFKDPIQQSLRTYPKIRLTAAFGAIARSLFIRRTRRHSRLAASSSRSISILFVHGVKGSMAVAARAAKNRGVTTGLPTNESSTHRRSRLLSSSIRPSLNLKRPSTS
jgi:hypothetical protein